MTTPQHMLGLRVMGKKGLDAYLKAIWLLTSSNAVTTRQTSNKFGLLSLLWQFCAYLFLPQKRHYEDYAGDIR
jgi:hypothetical protein